MRRNEEIWITGVGLACTLGNSFAELAESLLAGRSAVRPVTSFDASRHPSRIAAWMDPLACPNGWDASDFSLRDEWEQLILWCGVEALSDSGWWDKRGDKPIGLVLGIGAEWILRWEADLHVGGERIKQPERDAEGLTQHCHDLLGLHGPRVRVAAACASGNVAISVGREWIEQGLVDLCLVGAVEKPVTPMGLAGFGNLGALSRRHEAPAAASRPFDRDRDGFVLGEGGSLFVLEKGGDARPRSAKCYGRIAGYGAASDAFHLVSPAEDTRWAAAAIERSLEDAGIAADQLDYINAHATSTPVGDVFEAKALRQSLGSAVENIPVSATKSMTGHLVGAASALEAAVCLIALDRQAIPPTINLDDIDPACPLDHVARQARETPLEYVMSNSFGFGGSNTCLVLRKAA